MASRHHIDDVLPHDISLVKSFEDSIDLNQFQVETIQGKSPVRSPTTNWGDEDADAIVTESAPLTRSTHLHSSQDSARPDQPTTTLHQQRPHNQGGDDVRPASLSHTKQASTSGGGDEEYIAALFNPSQPLPPRPYSHSQHSQTTKTTRHHGHSEASSNSSPLTPPPQSAEPFRPTKQYRHKVNLATTRMPSLDGHFAGVRQGIANARSLYTQASEAFLTMFRHPVPPTPTLTGIEAGGYPAMTAGFPSQYPNTHSLPLFTGEVSTHVYPSHAQLNRFSLVLEQSVPTEYDILFKRSCSDVIAACTQSCFEAQEASSPPAAAAAGTVPRSNAEGSATVPLSTQLQSQIGHLETLQHGFAASTDHFLTTSRDLLASWKDTYTNGLQPYAENLCALYTAHTALYTHYTEQETEVLEELSTLTKSNENYTREYTVLQEQLQVNLNQLMAIDRHYLVLQRNASQQRRSALVESVQQIEAKTPATATMNDQQHHQYHANTLLSLPDRSFLLIISFLSPQDILNLMATNYAHYKRLTHGDITLTRLIPHIRTIHNKVRQQQAEQQAYNAMFLSKQYQCQINFTLADLTSQLQSATPSPTVTNAALATSLVNHITSLFPTAQQQQVASPTRKREKSISTPDGGHPSTQPSPRAYIDLRPTTESMESELAHHLLQLCLKQLHGTENQLQDSRENLQNRFDAQAQVNAFLSEQAAQVKAEYKAVQQQHDELAEKLRFNEQTKLELLENIKLYETLIDEATRSR